jgi:hypothetical protein
MNAEALLAAICDDPHDDDLRLVYADDPWSLLNALPELSKCAPLELIQIRQLDRSGAARLAEGPGLRHVVELYLDGADLDADSLAELAASAHLGGLRSLVLSNTDFNSNVGWLARAPGLGGLVSLEMDYCLAHDRMLKELAGRGGAAAGERAVGGRAGPSLPVAQPAHRRRGARPGRIPAAAKVLRRRLREQADG